MTRIRAMSLVGAGTAFGSVLARGLAARARNRRALTMPDALASGPSRLGPSRSAGTWTSGNVPNKRRLSW
jgi:hypothetical protein